MCTAPSAPSLDVSDVTEKLNVGTARWLRAAVTTANFEPSEAEGLTVSAVAAKEKTGTTSEPTPSSARNLGNLPTDPYRPLRDHTLFATPPTSQSHHTPSPTTSQQLPNSPRPTLSGRPSSRRRDAARSTPLTIVTKCSENGPAPTPPRSGRELARGPCAGPAPSSSVAHGVSVDHGTGIDTRDRLGSSDRPPEQPRRRTPRGSRRHRDAGEQFLGEGTERRSRPPDRTNRARQVQLAALDGH